MAGASQFTEEIRSAVLQGIREGKSLKAISLQEGMPKPPTVMDWVKADPAYAEQYARAKEVQAHVMAEDILSISDDGSNDTYKDDKGNERTDMDVIARSRLRVDTRKWLLSKMLPKVYGERLDINPDEGGVIQINHRIVNSKEELNADH